MNCGKGTSVSFRSQDVISMGKEALRSSHMLNLCCRPQITSKQLRDDLMTMLIAGHETTAAVLTWTLHCLNDRPDILRRMQQEVRLIAWQISLLRVQGLEVTMRD